MKRTLKLTFAYSIHSLFPIVSWLLWGVIKDQDYAATFTMTYIYQFIWAFLLCVFGYGTETYASWSKDNKRNIALSGTIVGTFIYVVVFAIGAIFAKSYLTAMGYADTKLVLPCQYSLICFGMSGMISLLAIYYNFKEDYTKGSLLLVWYNILVYVSLVVCLFLTKSDFWSVFISITLGLCYIVYNLVKLLISDLKGFRFIFSLRQSCKYVLGDLASNVGLFFTYLFGISNIISNDVTLMITFSVWLQIMDWIWDAHGNVASTIVRIDTTSNKFNYFSSFKNLAKINLIFYLIVGIETMIVFQFYNLNLLFIIIFAICDLSDLFIHIFKVICDNYLSAVGESKKVSVTILSGYALRVIITFIVPTAFGVYLAQLLSGIFKTIVLNILYFRRKRRLTVKTA